MNALFVLVDTPENRCGVACMHAGGLVAAMLVEIGAWSLKLLAASFVRIIHTTVTGYIVSLFGYSKTQVSMSLSMLEYVPVQLFRVSSDFPPADITKASQRRDERFQTVS